MQTEQCPRCGSGLSGGPVTTAGTARRCERHGPVPPLRVLEHVGPAGVARLCEAAGVPVWVPDPFPGGWKHGGGALVGDDVSAAVAVAFTVSSPWGGPGELVLVAEESAVGLGAALAAVPGADDPETVDIGAFTRTAPHAKITAEGRPTVLWSVPAAADRGAYVGEAAGVLLWVIGFPEEVAYLVHEDLQLADARVRPPRELPSGAPSRRLRP